MIYEILVRLKRAFVPLCIAAVGALAASPSSLAAPSATPNQAEANSPFSAIYVIGDSLSDTGRTAAAFAAANMPFLPPQYAPGRMSNGALWIEYFAPMVRKSYSPTENLAWAGAMAATYVVGNTLVSNIYWPSLPGLQQQLGSLYSATNGTFDPKALYVVFGGSNDFNQITLPTATNANTVICAAAGSVRDIVNTLHVFGAENIVVVNLPDLGQTPRVRRLGSNASTLATQLSMQYNALLDYYLNNLGFQVARVSLFDLFQDFLAKPKKYGFTNVTDPAFTASNPGLTYLFWDEVHPTTLAHRYLADEVFQAVAKAGMLSRKPN